MLLLPSHQAVSNVVSVLKRCMLVDIDVRGIQVVADAPIADRLGRSRQATKGVSGYTLVLELQAWRLVHGQFDDQWNPFNCGPIVCLKLMELFNRISVDEVKLAYATNNSIH
jgi:hypothetical protein